MTFMDLFRRGAREREMSDEMRFHIEMEAAELEAMGLDPVEARRRALASFGGVQRFKEEGREARGGAWFEDLLRDARYALRSLARSPGYAATVVLTLALGIAANTSIFSVANGILFTPLPYRDPARLMVIWDGLDMIGVPEAWVTGPEVVKLRSELRSFEGIAVVRGNSVTIGANQGGEPQQVPLSAVSANFFSVLGAGPSLGRGFAPGDDQPGAPRVAVISHRLWKQRFGGDSALLGQSMIVDGAPTRVVGVLPPTFQFSAQSSLGTAAGGADVYAPLPDTLTRMIPNNHSLGVLARVRGDVPVADALQELEGLSRTLDKEMYGSRGFRFVPVLLQERIVRQVRPALLALLSAVGMLLLIMSANLAVLALVRATRRDREIAVRRAIGASHGRVTRQVLTETVLLAIGGAVAGTLLGIWALRGLLAIAPVGLPRREEIGIDAMVLAVTLGVAVLVGIGMALAPIAHSARTDLSAVLREKAPSRHGSRVRHALVLAQLAMSMVLLAGTGLLLGSFMQLMRVDPGFNPRNVLMVELMASRAGYAPGQPVVDLYSRYVAALRALPGVTAVGASGAPPLSAGTDQSGVYFPSSPTNVGEREKDVMLGDVAPVTAGYFVAMGIPLLQGTEFTAAHRDTGTSRVAIISEPVARRYFPKGDAVGQPVTIDGDTLRVIGVSRQVRMYGLNEEGRGQVWVPHARTQYRYMVAAVRTTGDPMQLASAARRAIHSIDPQQAILGMTPMTDTIRDSLAERRLVLTLVGVFAGVAVLLAALGVYGVTASTVTQRTRELGIRMALGADRGSVIRSVLSEPARLVAAGLVIGLAGTLAAGRVVERLLYGVSPTDPVTLAAVALVLLGVALIASYLPARRATRVDPMIALRSD
jgi:putative ABC transport system permease protein